jgi:uncharacterized protein YtpQ (UPF0354 family)
LNVVPHKPDQWLVWLADRHDVHLDRDKDRYDAILAAWTRAGITLRMLDETIAECRRASRDPITDIVRYVDRVFANRATDRGNLSGEKASMADVDFAQLDYRAGVRADGGF